MGRRRAPELYRAPFPLYALRVEPSTGLLITAGGGGAAKTGIKNGVHFLQLEQIGGALSASLLHSHDTETKATMNLALAGNILAAGQDASCQLLQFRPQEQETGDKQDDAGSQEQGPRQRKGMGATTETQEMGASTQREEVELNVENLQSVQTDFGSDPLQKTVCFNHDNTLLATGGTDGFVRVWQVPSLEKVLEFKAHDGEIEDLTLGPGDKMVTAGWDFKACVWQRDQLVTGLRWDVNLPPLPDTPYRYQACSLEKVLEFKAHDGEIEDLTLGPGDKMVTAGWDFKACVWQRDQLVTGLRWDVNLPPLPDTPYRYQACRFGWVPDQPAGLRLFTVQIPHKRLRRPPPCYLTAWDGHNFLPLRTQPCGNEVISCLSVSESGTFLGLGTVTGSVAIYISFSLQRLYYLREAHGIVVTDVAFLPEQGRSRELLGSHEAALFSVAVDSRCQLHLLPIRRSVPVWLLLLLCAGLIILAILLLQSAFPGFL